ncbi:MAG: hypothetical protein HYU66_02455 [Armatimonadetes bacterium]|nr:hypothetical protein [Armatimonadota bacterium]
MCPRRACWFVLLLSAGAVRAAERPDALRPWLDGVLAEVAQAGCASLGTAELAGGSGVTGRYLAARLESALRDGAAGRWQVNDGAAIATALRKAGVSGDKLAEPRSVAPALADLRLDALLVGTVRRDDDKLRVDTRLLRLPDGPTVGLPTLDLPLDGDLLALGGESYAVDEQRGVRPVCHYVLRLARDRDDRPPVMDPACLFRLELLVDGRPRQPEQRGREAVAKLGLGQTYSLRITNNSHERMGVALFVDGLNTVGQKRELPSAGLKWIVGPGHTVEVKGWQLGLELRRAFTVVGAGESVAGQRGLTDQLGLITASFYAEAQPAAGGGDGAQVGGEERRELPFGTGEGGSERSDVREVEFKAAEVPAAVLGIRYEVELATVGG